MRAARLSVVLVTIVLLVGCRAPARPAVGVPAGAGPINAAPMIGLDGGTLKTGPNGQMIGLDGGTIDAMSAGGAKGSKTTQPATTPSAQPSAVACDLIEALDSETVQHPAGQAIELSVDVAKGTTVTWQATAGQVLGSGGDAVWQPAASGGDATITAAIATSTGTATLTWVAAEGAAGVTLAGPVVTDCAPTP